MLSRPITALALFSTLALSRPAAADTSKLSPDLQLASKLPAAIRPSSSEPLDLMVRLERTPTTQERSALRARGVEMALTPTPTGAYSARALVSDVGALTTLPWVRSVSRGGVSPFMRLLDTGLIHETTTDGAARTALGNLGLWLDGTGTTVGDVDSDAWVFHPSLFRADAGAFAWIDNDGNGAFNPGVDAVDLDGDGVSGEGERALPLRVELRDLSFDEVPTSADFDALRDYLYLDLDQNGKRDFGAGFMEREPAFGEPLFVVDDANGNGRLDPSERVLRLGTSKFAIVRRRGKTYTRGDQTGHGIIDYGVALAKGLKSARSPEHGTYMTSIIAGGNGSNRARGLAPGADLVLVTEPNLADVTWLLDQPVVSVSFPIGTNIGEPLDGSSELELLVDAFWKRGIVAAASVGNSGGLRSHAAVAASPGDDVAVPFDLKYPVDAAYFSAVLPGPGADLELTVTDAAGAPLPGQTRAASTSPRGTKQAMVVVDAKDRKGALVLHVKVASAGTGGKVHVYSSSDNGYPVSFTASTTDASTLGSPATADESLGATGYVLHTGAAYGFADESAPGSLAWFASRGPRVDGRPLTGIAAPVNPVGATVMVTEPGRVAVRAWPGTSGSSPQVAAAAALLHQAFPTASATELRDRLLHSARTDDFVTGGSDVWGTGKLDVAAALGAPALSSPAPTVVLELDKQPAPGERVALRAKATGTGAIVARWDLDYDGRWDTPFEPALQRELVAPAKGRIAARVEIHDASGATAGASLLADLRKPSPAPTPVSPPRAEGCSLPTSSRTAPSAIAFLTVLFTALALRRRTAR